MSHLSHPFVRSSRTSSIVVSFGAALVFAASLVHVGEASASPEPPGAKTATVKLTGVAARGEYLATIMGCNDCHTPFIMGPQGPEPDMTRRLSGHPEGLVVESPALPPAPWGWLGALTNTAFAGPWGVSFAANLTPDPETGRLVGWSEKTFIETIRTGRHQGRGRPILPPMPWPMYRSATDKDLAAIFAYLKTLPPVRNRVPQPIEPVSAEGAP